MCFIKKDNRLKIDEIEKNALFSYILKFYKSFNNELGTSVEFNKIGKLSKLIPDYDFESFSLPPQNSI